MATISQLRKLIARERKLEDKKKKARMQVEEKARLKKQLFHLKHSGKIKTYKKITGGLKTAGKNFSANVSGASKSWSNQRKKKKGLGGFLQNIADKQ